MRFRAAIAGAIRRQQRAINLQFRAIQVAVECLPFARRAMNEQNARRARAIEFGVLQRVAGDGLRLQFRPWWIREQLFHLASGIRRTEAGTEQRQRSEEHTSELQSLMRISYAVFCLKKKTKHRPYPPMQ